MEGTRMSNESNGSSGGIGFVGLLQLVFIALKLMGYIEWSWLWVLSPTWIGFVLWVLVAVIFVIIHRRWWAE